MRSVLEDSDDHVGRLAGDECAPKGSVAGTRDDSCNWGRPAKTATRLFPRRGLPRERPQEIEPALRYRQSALTLTLAPMLSQRALSPRALTIMLRRLGRSFGCALAAVLFIAAN